MPVMQAMAISTLRILRWVGVPLIIISIIPARPATDAWLVVFWISFAVLTCIPFSLLRTAALFWPLFSAYALLTAALIMMCVRQWVPYLSAGRHWDAGCFISLLCQLNILAQPICIVALRHYRNVVANGQTLRAP
jgi:hypothetical protein